MPLSFCRWSIFSAAAELAKRIFVRNADSTSKEAHFVFGRNGSAMPDISPEFDQALKRQSWNLIPQAGMTFPTSIHHAVNAATAIAICAYPEPRKLKWNGKAHKYQQALLAYIVRASQWTGYLDHLPPWVHELKTDRMWNRLATGHQNLARSFVVRDLINAALIEKIQNDRANRGELSTFEISFSNDLRLFNIEIPIQETSAGDLLIGKTTRNTGRTSLRSVIKKYRPALAEFEGPSPRVEGNDEEYYYQNMLTRFVKPTLQTFHILQVVSDAANQYQDEAKERRLPIDQILMRKGEWATDLYEKVGRCTGMAIFEMRELGIPSCSCKLIQLGPPSPDS